jgi:hypothetical protein
VGDYVGPFGLANGNHTYAFQARDVAGRLGTLTNASLPVDLTAPVGTPTGKTANILLQLLGIPTSTTLGFNATDNLTPRVRVRVFVYNELGTLIRRLDAPGPYLDGYRNQGNGSVVWDGRDSANRGALPGAYHYRVHVTDQAGNTQLGIESKPFLVVQGILPR